MDARSIAALLDLISTMNTAEISSQNELQEKQKDSSDGLFERMIRTGETFGQASGAPDFYNHGQSAFFAYLRKTDNDLIAQAGMVSDFFRRYRERGEIPPPYFSWRIAVILSKAKRKDLEKQFLASWCRHFGDFEGTRYRALAERYAKLNSGAFSNK